MQHPPKDVEHLTGFFKGRGNSDLFWHSWTAAKAKGRVTIVHGFGEYAARYHHFAAALARAGFAVLAFDCRGHGRSSGRRAYIQSFSDYSQDLEGAVTQTAALFPDLPHHIFGHSNGGLIAIHHASSSPQSSKIASYAFTSPFLGFKLEVPALKATAGKILSGIFPKFQLPTELDAKWISRNQKIVDAYREDPRVLKIATARWFTETQKTQASLINIVSEFSVPSLWLVAQADEIADPKTSENIFNAVGSKEKVLHLLPDHYHEVLNDLEWTKQAQVLLDHFGKYS